MDNLTQIIEDKDKEDIQPALCTVYQGEVIDIQLNSLAEEATQDMDYQGICDLVRRMEQERQPIKRIPRKK